MSSNDIFRNIGVNGYASGLMAGTIWWSEPNPDCYVISPSTIITVGRMRTSISSYIPDRKERRRS